MGLKHPNLNFMNITNSEYSNVLKNHLVNFSHMIVLKNLNLCFFEKS